MDIDMSVIAAAMALGMGAAATGYAQAHIGSAAVAALVEKKELLVAMIVLVAIPETMVILGFVIAYLILQ